jgi:predicted phage tail protein
MESNMRTSRLILAAVVFLVGLVWTAQGLGLIGGSAMSNVTLFAVIGAALMVGGVVIALRERQAASRP